MNRKSLAIAVVCFGAWLQVSEQSSARPIQRKTWSAVHSEADMVVIAAVIESRDTSSDEHPDLQGIGVPQESILQIHTVFKGENVPKQLRLFHFRYKRVDEGGEATIPNPPSMLLSLKPSPSLPLSGKTLAWAPANPVSPDAQDGHYLMFLRSRRDGRVEPAGGQIDPINSVFSLTKAGPPYEHP